MASLNRKFVCLPEYECCCRPRGKAVCESTMLNHRRAANKRLSDQGLSGDFPRGPKYSEADSVLRSYADLSRVRKRRTYRGSTETSTPDVGGPSSTSRTRPFIASNPVPMAVVDSELGEGCPELMGREDSRVDLLHCTTRGANEEEGQALTRSSDRIRAENALHLFHQLPTNTSEQRATTSHDRESDTSPTQIEQPFEVSQHTSPMQVDQPFDISEQGLQHTESNARLGYDCDDEAHSNDSYEDGSTSSGHLENEYVEEYSLEKQTTFREWADSNRKSIDLYLKRGLEHAVMDDILKTAGAGYKSWKTVVFRLTKDTGLKNAIEEYAVCIGHMCFVPDPDSVSETEPMFCSECGKEEPSLCNRSTTRMRYIPFLPRLRAMIRDEAKCEALFSYREEHLTNSAWKSDVFDGDIFARITSELQIDVERDYDIFIAASTDGFEVFKKGTCDIWPVVGIIHNLPPNLRFKMHNVLPFSFIPGSKEPKNLQSFLLPLIYEIESINANGGTEMIFPDGSSKRVRVHLLWFTGDLPAIAKVGGLIGHNGKMPCRFCLQEGFYFRLSKHYYYPSRIKVDGDNGPASSNARITVLCDLRSANTRTEEHSFQLIARLEDERGRSRDEFRRDSGIREDSALFRLPTMYRYISLPIDTMHLLYNVSRRMLDEIVQSKDEPYSLSRVSLSEIDSEILRAGANISSQLGSRPRRLSAFKDWKAAEHKDFVLSYSLVFLDGYLPEIYMSGWAKFVELSDICYRPVLSDDDIESAHRLAVEFLDHFETHYFRFEESRVGLCKYVFHLLKHVAENMQNCGPLVNCSQLWVERYIGWIGNRLHARHQAAESLLNNALHCEAYKLFFNVPFHQDDEDTNIHTVQDGLILLGPHQDKTSDLDSEEPTQLYGLLLDYIQRKYVGMSRDEAVIVVNAGDYLKGSSRLKFLSGSEVVVAGAYTYYKPTEEGASRRRANWFVATEMDETATSVDVYYGRLLRLYSFRVKEEVSSKYAARFASWQREYKIGMIDWVTGLEVGKYGQIYKNVEAEHAFSAPTIEDLSIIQRLISVVDHVVPSQTEVRSSTARQSTTRGGRGRGRVRCYFMDGAVLKDHLLEEGKPCEDDFDRNLKRVLRRN